MSSLVTLYFNHWHYPLTRIICGSYLKCGSALFFFTNRELLSYFFIMQWSFASNLIGFRTCYIVEASPLHFGRQGLKLDPDSMAICFQLYHIAFVLWIGWSLQALHVKLQAVLLILVVTFWPGLALPVVVPPIRDAFSGTKPVPPPKLSEVWNSFFEQNLADCTLLLFFC